MAIPIPVALSNTPTDYTLKMRNYCWSCASFQLFIGIIRMPLICLASVGGAVRHYHHHPGFGSSSSSGHHQNGHEGPNPNSNHNGIITTTTNNDVPGGRGTSCLTSFLEIGMGYAGLIALRNGTVDVNCLLSWGYFCLLKGVLDLVVLCHYAANSFLPMFVFDGKPVAYEVRQQLPDLAQNAQNQGQNLNNHGKSQTAHHNYAPNDPDNPQNKIWIGFEHSAWRWNLIMLLNIAPPAIFVCSGLLVHTIWNDISEREERMVREYLAQQQVLFGIDQAIVPDANLVGQNNGSNGNNYGSVDPSTGLTGSEAAAVAGLRPIENGGNNGGNGVNGNGPRLTVVDQSSGNGQNGGPGGARPSAAQNAPMTGRGRTLADEDSADDDPLTTNYMKGQGSNLGKEYSDIDDSNSNSDELEVESTETNSMATSNTVGASIISAVKNIAQYGTPGDPSTMKNMVLARRIKNDPELQRDVNDVNKLSNNVSNNNSNSRQQQNQLSSSDGEQNNVEERSEEIQEVLSSSEKKKLGSVGATHAPIKMESFSGEGEQL